MVRPTVAAVLRSALAASALRLLRGVASLEALSVSLLHCFRSYSRQASQFAIHDSSFTILRPTQPPVPPAPPETLPSQTPRQSLLASPCPSDFPRKEVIQPHLPVRLPCYDFVPVIRPTLGSSPLAVESPTSGVPNSHDVTGGVYKARERIHRSMADLRLLATPASCRRVAACNLNYERLWWDSLQVAPSLPIVPPIVACV